MRYATAVLAAFTALGLLGLLVSAFAARAAHRQLHTLGLAWWRHQALPLLAGLLSALASPFLGYAHGEDTTIVGFPFPAAAFIRGLDYVGITTLPAMLGNAMFFLLVPQIFLAGCLRAKHGRHATKLDVGGRPEQPLDDDAPNG